MLTRKRREQRAQRRGHGQQADQHRAFWHRSETGSGRPSDAAEQADERRPAEQEERDVTGQDSERHVGRAVREPAVGLQRRHHGERDAGGARPAIVEQAVPS